jgi:hypothetical protein
VQHGLVVVPFYCAMCSQFVALDLPTGHVTVTLFCVNTVHTFTDTLYYPTRPTADENRYFMLLQINFFLGRIVMFAALTVDGT